MKNPKIVILFTISIILTIIYLTILPFKKPQSEKTTTKLTPQEKFENCNIKSDIPEIFIKKNVFIVKNLKLEKINIETCRTIKTRDITEKDSENKIVNLQTSPNKTIYITLKKYSHYRIRKEYSNELKEINKVTLIDECYLKSSILNKATFKELDKICLTNPELQTISIITKKYGIKTYKNPDMFTKPHIKLIFTGDAMLARSIGSRIEKGENVFKNIETEFKDSDFTVLNLETTLTNNEKDQPLPQKAWTFNAPIEAVPLMKSSGIDITNLANNHTCDYGKEGLINQMKNLKNGNLIYYGAGENKEKAFQAEIIESKGIKIALLGFNAVETIYSNAKEDQAGSAYFNKSLTKKAIEKAKKEADIVIVSGHAGIEGQLKHNSYQEEYYKHFIDSGADIVISHHPHVPQDYEKYKGKMIYYSLGNLTFETGNRENYKKAYLAEVKINPFTKDIEESNLIDIKLENGIPKLKL